ncbi:hypothetical protein O181_027654 [Austropuccinia psidii MF-1]|uniref:Uncharacterized protein n=1 Tax=Austropuccinia psidii MF-1 TaxID=1389203 RepID=A0A9Q3CPC8_9BASI|nr:hypothetical protein [Austropuccinia psidii MF-1]
MLRMCAYRDEIAIAQWGAFDIFISIAQQLCNSNVQQVSMSIMTLKQTGAIVTPIVFICPALYALSGVSSAFVHQQRPTLVMLADKHTRNACSLSNPSNHVARGVPAQETLTRTPLWSMMMKVFPSGNGHQDPKQADGNDSGRLALSTPLQWSLHSLTGGK